MTNLGDFFQMKRRERNMKLGDVARAFGYKNLNKGCRKIRKIEETGFGDTVILQKLVTFFEIKRAEYHEAIDKDVERATAEFEKASGKIFNPMYLMGTLEHGYPIYLPREIKTEEDAIKWAVEFVKNRECHRKRITLEVSLKIFYCINTKDGEYIRCPYSYTRFYTNIPIYNAKHVELQFADDETENKPIKEEL